MEGSCDTCKHWEQFRAFGVCKLTKSCDDIAEQPDPGQQSNTAFALCENSARAWLWTYQDFCCNRFEEDKSITFG